MLLLVRLPQDCLVLLDNSIFPGPMVLEHSTQMKNPLSVPCHQANRKSGGREITANHRCVLNIL
jgi:hypothetical protein